jgi:hypothetical protein
VIFDKLLLFSDCQEIDGQEVYSNIIDMGPNPVGDSLSVGLLLKVVMDEVAQGDVLLILQESSLKAFSSIVEIGRATFDGTTVGSGVALSDVYYRKQFLRLKYEVDTPGGNVLAGFLETADGNNVPH